VIRPRSGFFNVSNFLLTRLDIVRDGFLNIHYVGRGVSTPLAGVPKLLPVFLQRLCGAIDRSTGLLRRVARPHMWAVENRRLMALPIS
jgi:hypothetical protein